MENEKYVQADCIQDNPGEIKVSELSKDEELKTEFEGDVEKDKGEPHLKDLINFNQEEDKKEEMEENELYGKEEDIAEKTEESKVTKEESDSNDVIDSLNTETIEKEEMNPLPYAALDKDTGGNSLPAYTEGIEQLNRTMLRLEKKFDNEILNAENRDNAVKAMYKELNEYKAGIIERALKSVLYDIVDIREVMLSQIKHLKKEKGQDSISLDDFETYASDLADILEKYDVKIYKANSGEENIAVRQKIIRKVETEDDSLVKKIAESLSFGYEYNSKILYPEKISIYIKKEKE